MKRLSLLLVLSLVTALRMSAQLSGNPDIAAVRKADEVRLKAMMAGDGAALERLMSDELRFVHSDGRIETKRDYVKNMMAGDTAYTDAKTFDLQALQPAPGVVILMGGQDMRKRLGPTWSDIKLRFMSIWRNENGTWRMYAWQSMKPSGSSIVPGKK